MKTKTDARRGQGLVEFCLTVPILIGLGSAIVILLLLLFSRSVLDVESFRVARARLYGNTVKACAPGEIFSPPHPLTRYTCSGSSPQVQAQLKWHPQHAQTVRWNLQSGTYLRSPGQ